MIKALENLPGGVIGFESSGKLEAQDLRSLHRFALVTDSEWMRHFVTAFGWMVPGDVKHFPMAERTQAIRWAAAT